MTKTEFSRERHVSRARVYQWIQDGRVQVLEDGRIDADDAHARLGAMLDQAKGVRQDGNITSVAPGAAPAAQQQQDPGPAAAAPRDDKGYWADKAREQAAVATLAELKALQAAGALVSAAAVKKEATETGRRLRNALLSIPDEVAQVLDPGNPERAHKLLTDKITKALREFRVGLEQRAAAPAGADEREPALL